MAEPLRTHTLEFLQDLFYRSKFGQLLTELDAIEAENEVLSNELLLLKANVLFELHKVAECKDILKQVRKSNDTFDVNYLYAAARLAYLDGENENALALAEEIYNQTDDPHQKFKSLLGIANTHYTLGSMTKIPKIIEDLCSFEPLKKDDERISLMIFLGNYYFASGASSDLAKTYFKKAMTTSAANTWTYFITRSLYGMACVHERAKATNELMWTLDILQSFVDESEQLFFSHIVNSKFKSHFAISTPVEFDTENRRVLIKNAWIPFHDKPMLFQFLLLLHERSSFVTKDSIAADLWPDEGYKPRVHDPRIFDIAKRARHLIEAYESQPVVLLSGRMGYKLASI
jgi:tetratricopeptide (TPR) repeat protein